MHTDTLKAAWGKADPQRNVPNWVETDCPSKTPPPSSLVTMQEDQSIDGHYVSLETLLEFAPGTEHLFIQTFPTW